MARTINVESLFEPVEVDLFGEATYRMRESTQSVVRQLAEQEKEMEAVSEDDVDAQMQLVIQLIDTLLEPIPNGDGKKVAAKTVLARMWKAEKIGRERIMRLADEIQEEMMGRTRPTSQPQTSG